jgi:hypothetical protein
MREEDFQIAQWAVSALSDEEASEIQNTLWRRIPTDLVKRYWGGGVRLNRLPPSSFREGLARACDDAQVLQFVALVWRPRIEPLLNAVTTAAARWPSRDTGVLSDHAFEWVVERFQPSLEELAWLHLAYDSPRATTLPDPARLALAGKSHFLLRSAGDRTSQARNILTNPAPFLGDIALELLGLFVDPSGEVPGAALQQLEMGNISAAATALGGTDSPFAIEAALLRFLEGDLQSAKEFVQDPNQEWLARQQRLAFRALLALHEGNDADCLGAISEARLEGPGWHLLHGLMHARGARFAAAARSFLAQGGGYRSNSILPVDLAAAALEAGGIDVPEVVGLLLEKGWASHHERLVACEAVNEAVPDSESIPDEASVITEVQTEVDHGTGSLGNSVEQATHSGSESTSVPLGPTSSTAFHLLDADNQNIDDPELQSRVSELRSAVEELLRLLDEAASGLKDILGLQRILRRAEEVRARVLAADSALRSCGGIDSDFPKPLRETEAGSAEALVAYVRAVMNATSRMCKRRTREMAEQKALWRSRCLDVGYSVPQELDLATTLNDLGEAVSALQPTIARRTFERAIRDQRRYPEWARLTPRERLASYSALLEGAEEPPDVVERALGAAIEDREALKSARESAVALLAAAVRLLCAAQRRLPVGVWDAISTLVPGGFDSTIRSVGLDECLRDAEPEDVDGAGLHAACAGQSTLPEVARVIALQEARTTTDSARRVQLLAGLAELTPGSAELLREFAGALATAKRAAAALFVARYAHESFHDDVVWKLLVQATLEARIQGRPEGGIADLVRERAQDWVTSPEDIVALLLTRNPAERRDVFELWQYQLGDPARAVRTRYPRILSSLLKDAAPAPETDKSPAPNATAVRELLDAFRTENAKKTIFASWQGGGERYQTWFRDELDALLRRALAGDTRWFGERDFSVEGLILRAEKSGLPKMYDHAARSARASLDKQLSRLKQLGRLVAADTRLLRMTHEDDRDKTGARSPDEFHKLTQAWRNEPGLAAAVTELLRLEQT